MEKTAPEYLVSVCVIAYNHEKYIAECLDSILRQKTNFKFNIFVSDDCSPDSTYAIIQDYAARYPNVIGISRCGLPKSYVNGVPTGNLNFIENLERTTAEFVAICDGDDVWNSDEKLQTQINLLRANDDVALVCSARNKIKDGVFHPNRFVLPDFKFSYQLLCFYNPIPTSSVVFRRADMKPQPEWFFNTLVMGDWPFWFQVTRYKKIIRQSKAYIDYRIHSQGAWGKMKTSEKAMSSLMAVRVMRKHYGEGLFTLSLVLHFLRYQFHKAMGN